MATDTRTRDTVNSLLNYDVSDNEDDPFREIDTTFDKPDDRSKSTKRKATGSDNKENADILGLDEEVKITKKRKPVAKLDEARLLSQPGIPKLRALARSKSIASKLRLKGKGHEYSDAAKLLSYYQLWLDNLYPRAKFADGLQLVEKVGHSKRMQVMRREWIDEGKPGYGEDLQDRASSSGEGEKDENGAVIEGGDNQFNNKQPEAGLKESTGDSVFDNLDEGDDDLFFADANAKTSMNNDNGNEPDEDELEALLAEDTSKRDSPPQLMQLTSNEDEDDDDNLDALLAEGDEERNRPGEEFKEQKQGDPDKDVDGLDAVLAEKEAVNDRQPEDTMPGRKDVSPEEDEDELEALLAEQAGST
jgi:replication fork protection complex subunit Csm3/Swi3